MKRFLFTGAAMLAFAMSATAQSTTDPNMSNPMPQNDAKDHGTMHQKAAKSGKKMSMRGCIEQSGDEYMLKTKSAKNVELMSTEDLKPHVGHMVKVTGAWDKSMDKQHDTAEMDHTSMPNGQAKGDMKGHMEGKEHHFKVSNMEMISETCTMDGNKKK